MYIGQTVEAEVDVSHLPGKHVDRTVVLTGLSVPIKFEEVCERLVALGYQRPVTFIRRDNSFGATITSGPSRYCKEGGGYINIDDPLIVFTGKHYTPTVAPAKKKKDPQMDIADISENGITVGGVEIGFQRTIRVPDNGNMNALPPGLGTFPLHDAVKFARRSPGLAAMGGVVMPMYQREALWMSFKPRGWSSSYAVKVSVGGVNALTGSPQDQPSRKQQDYLVVNRKCTQPWLDGISNGKGVVRQFVAMPLGSGFSVEEQMTGDAKNGGIQIDVFESYEARLRFGEEHLSPPVNVYRTPRQLGWRVDQRIFLHDVENRCTGTAKTLDVDNPVLHTSSPRVILIAGADPPMRIHVKHITGKILTISCVPSNSIGDLKEKLQEPAHLESHAMRLIFDGCQLEDGFSLAHYDILAEAIMVLILRLRGGGYPTGYVPPSEPHVFTGEGLMSIAAGGQIKQNIVRDTVPGFAYDQENGARLRITILNSAMFATITGLQPPSSPVSTQTYIDGGLPWYTFYDEGTPMANNVSAQHPLAKVQSVGTLMKRKREQDSCEFCSYEFAAWRIQPCGHLLCKDCANGLSTKECPAHCKTVRGRVRIVTTEPSDRLNDSQSKAVKAESQDARIVELKRVAQGGMVGTVRSNVNNVSKLFEGLGII